MYLNKIIIKHNHPSRYQFEITWSQLKIDQNIEFDMELGVVNELGKFLCLWFVPSN